MIITSSSLNIHTFLNIATAATGIIPTINVVHVCLYICAYNAYVYTECFTKKATQSFRPIAQNNNDFKNCFFAV